MNAQESIEAWFKILGERGEWVNLSVFEVPKNGSDISEHEFFHGNMDGIGSFLTVVDKKVDLFIPELPQRKDPPWFVYALNFLRYLRRLPFYSSRWKISTSWRPGRPEKPIARAFRTLSREDTLKFWAHAKQLGVGRNAYLLYHLNRAVEPYLEFKKNFWLIPVNLRMDMKAKEGNIVGFVDGKLTPSTSVKELDLDLRSRLSRGEAYGGYVGISLGRFLGHALLRFVVWQNDFIQIRTGVFTNLGNWKTQTPVSSSWFGLPPVIKTQPVGAMTGSLNEEQSLALHFHPSLTRDPKLAEECLERWISSLLKNP